MTYSVAERVAIVEAYINTGSIKETRKIFGSKFPGKGLLAKTAIQALVKKWCATGSVANAPKQRSPSVRTPEVTDDIRRKIMQSLKKSTCKLLPQAHISRTMCRHVLKSLDLKPFHVTVLQQLQEADVVKQVNYCTWLLNSICAGLLDPFQYIMSDEAWFHLSGHVNSQNTRYWAAENPHLMHEQPLQKIGVCCAVSGTRIIGLIFFERTVNTEVYMNIFEEFCAQLTEEERQSFLFQQDGATCHTSRVSLQRVHDVFSEEGMVSKNLWPPRSPDLTTCDYFLW
jgi:hypothetical protein